MRLRVARFVRGQLQIRVVLVLARKCPRGGKLSNSSGAKVQQGWAHLHLGGRVRTSSCTCATRCAWFAVMARRQAAICRQAVLVNSRASIIGIAVATRQVLKPNRVGHTDTLAARAGEDIELYMCNSPRLVGRHGAKAGRDLP